MPEPITTTNDRPPFMKSPNKVVGRRRSLRLASKSDASAPADESETPVVEHALRNDAKEEEEEEEEEKKKKKKTAGGVDLEEEEKTAAGVDLEEEKAAARLTGKGKRKSEDLGEVVTSLLTLRSGRKVSKKTQSDIANLKSEKGKGKLVNENISLNNVGDGSDAGSSRRRLTREEKGKGVMVAEDLGDERDFALSMELNEEIVEDDVPVDEHVPVSDEENVELEEEVELPEAVVNDAGRTYMGRFRSIAQRNAVRFAHYNAETGEAHINRPFQRVIPSVVGQSEAEDWPGPFSTAMKIIKDRANKANVQQRTTGGTLSSKDEPLWVPKESLQPKKSKSLAPSLEDLSLDVLVKNVEAISSLNNVPDAIRHKLCQVLSDSRKMSGSLFKLLLSGSPVEVRVKDSSWLTEEEFMEHFAGCDTSNLLVLQLDQCGRCMPDYVVHATIARSTNSLPVLAALSLQAACRLSDGGLSAIASAAPRLQSINLSQCSLLTSIGIKSLSKSLGSVLRELYIDDCQSINMMKCLPYLKDVKCLEVLSVAGIESVCDDFINELMITHGQCLKELNLTDCMYLTDSSLKAIAENSSSLCALNLVNISNLTDIGIGYLANGVLKFKILKLCRNAFSDEALAAFVETSGDCLEELWLNNINMVGRQTAVSLAKHSRKLVTLDVSWCRNLTDDALGLIVDSCDCLRILKIFGCTQLTDVFFNGHSNQNVQVIGRKMTPILKHIKGPNPLQGPLRYSSVSYF